MIWYGKKKSHIYFLRYAQSELNADPRLPDKNAGLSKKGVRDAQNLSKVISKWHFDHIFSSPRLRAEQTAKIITPARMREQIIFCEDLMECRRYEAPLLLNARMQSVKKPS